MGTVSDVIVVGGGPCGSFAALNLAKFCTKVTVFEEHDEIGVPSHCTGHLSITGLKRLGLYPLPAKVVENTFYGADFYSPKGSKFSVRFSSPVTCVINRIFFDKFIAETAETRGVRYCLNSRVESLIIEDDFVKGVTAKHGGKASEEFLAKIVIDAEGTSSRILRQAGLPSLNRRMLVNGVQAEFENVTDIEPKTVEVFLGKNYAPGLYAWLVPKNEEMAKVGLATRTGNPKELLQRLMLKHPIASQKLRKAKLLRTTFHPIPLGGPIPKTYSNGFLVVGDVASQVKPTTGGGVVFGMTCARAAAEVACKALHTNDFSSEFLELYQKRCEETLSFDVNIMLKARRMLDAMSDEKIDDAINFCRKFELDKILRNVEDIDFQGQALLRALRTPRMLTAFAYFFFPYLFGNL
jgi:digeranylgeranylglycerophospholipid reductase